MGAEGARIAAGGLATWLGRTLGAEQERWFLWLPVTYGAGSAAYFALADEPPLLPLALAAAVAAGLYALARQRGLWIVAAGLMFALAAGALGGKIRTEVVRAPVLAGPVSSVDINGWVELVEPRLQRGQRITIQVARITGLEAAETPVRVRVRTLAADAALAPGDAIAVRANLSPPPPPAYPGSYDFGFMAYYMGLGAVGAATGPVARLPALGPPPAALRARAIVEGIRYRITQRIMAALPGETGAIAAALITGERGGISEDTNNAYRDSGLFHVLSISGLHMVIMAGAMFFVARLLLAAIPALVLNYPIKKWAAVLALFGALGYLLISGASFATVRSYIMITVMFFAILLDRPAVALRNIALSALIILLLYPESVLDPGFQMSFAAVTALVAVHETLRRRREARERLGRGSPPLMQPAREVAAIVLSTIIASIAVAPFSIYHFHNTQTLALIANVVAIPVCNMIVMPAALGVLLAMPFALESLPLTVMGWGVDVMTWVAAQVAALPGAVALVPAISTPSFLLLVAGGLWLLLWVERWRYAAVPVLAAGIAIAPVIARPDIIIGRDGEAFAIRGADGLLAVPDKLATNFEVTRWREIDGDRRARRAKQDAKTRDALPDIACDMFGCVAAPKGRQVQVLAGGGGLRDACGVADIIVMRFDRPAACGASDTARNTWARQPVTHDQIAQSVTPERPLILDATQLARGGVHLIFFERDGSLRIQTVEQIRAERPWGSRGDRPDDPRRRAPNTIIADIRERPPAARP